MLELDGVEQRRPPGRPGSDDAGERRRDRRFVGPNGAGKTTLLKTVIGLERPTAGRIRFMDTDVTRLAPHRTRRAGIAMALQNPRTFATMSVRENVMLGALFGSVDGRRRPTPSTRPTRRSASSD